MEGSKESVRRTAGGKLEVGVQGAKPTLHVLLAACARSGGAGARMTSAHENRGDPPFLHLLFDKKFAFFGHFGA